MKKKSKSIPGGLFRGLRAFFQEIRKPESFVKGEVFENYVRNKLFPISEYKLIHKTTDYNNNKGDYVETTLYPDFRLKDKENGKLFFVEVKWRNGESKAGKISWCDQKQLRRYKAIDKKENKVFIILGVGGRASKPERIALFPVSDCAYIALYDTFINKYSIPVNKPVTSKYLWRLR